MDLRAMHREINAARCTLENADEIAASIARILQGRLRHVPTWVLQEIKKELKDFNAHTGVWR